MCVSGPLADTTAATALAVFMVALLILQMTPIAGATYWLTRRFVAANSPAPDKAPLTSHHGNVMRVLRPLYMDSRDTSSVPSRLCVLEDIAFSHGMAALVGLRLADLHGCRAVALLMVALSLAHVGYSAILRPWRARSDSLIAVGFATGNAVLGALVATFLFALPEGNVTGIGKAIGAVQLVLDVALYAEVVLAAALAIRQRFWVAANHDAVNPLPPDRDPAGTSEGLLERVPALSTEPRYSSSESPSFPSAPRNPLGR
jgi:hypothetical protein